MEMSAITGRVDLPWAFLMAVRRERNGVPPPPLLYGDALFSITYKGGSVRESFIFNELAKKRSAASACFTGCQPRVSSPFRLSFPGIRFPDPLASHR